MFRPLLISLCLTSTALATTWTVDDDGKADFNNIQAAVDAASNGDEIIVMPGTYTSTQDGHVVNMMGKAVTLRSSDPSDPDVVATTIIDGEGARRGLACFNEETSKTIISGFTITNGYGVAFDYNGDGDIDWWEDNGGGMCNYSSSPTLTNCTFESNTAQRGGGMHNYNSNPTLTDCTFTNNTSNEGQDGEPSSGGAGMHNYNSSPTLTNCTFTGNTATRYGGGGMFNDNNSNPTIENCTFENNNASYGGGGMCNYINTYPTLTDCTFTNNSADHVGGGMFNYGSSPTLENCTFESNSVDDVGGGMCNSSYTNVTLTDTTVCANSPDQIDGDWTDNGGNWVADECPSDVDEDGVDDSIDNCYLYNPDQADCNENGIGDICDVADSTSFDCDQNNVPDECQPDCDGDGWIDACDSEGDCDDDGIPDNCELDCNENNIPDDCDIIFGISQDCNENGIPDECDLADGTAEDCNYNGVPDSCDITDGTEEDCNENGVPDSCELLVPVQTKLLASDVTTGEFGHHVFISGDGTTAIIGADSDFDNGSGSGSAYIYRFDGNKWIETKLLPSDGASDDRFGISVSISSDGTTAIVGAYADDDNGDGSGSAYIYQFDGSNWIETKLLASDGETGDLFGYSVSISSDGTTAIVAASGDDSGNTYIYRFDGSGWQETKLLPSDVVSSRNVCLSSDGNRAIVGACYGYGNGSGSGSAYIFSLVQGIWQETKLLASDGAGVDYFGYSVATNGDTVVVGAPRDDDNGDDSGSAYIYQFDGSNWIETKLLASDGAIDDYFGISVTISAEGTVIVGAFYDDDNGSASGSAYIYRFDGSDWNFETKLLASDGTEYDYFGCSVSISSDSTTAIVGAYGWDIDFSNSAYIYELDESEFDCNSNGILDECDLEDPANDQNNNGVIDECECVGDADLDGHVNVNDLLIIIGYWGNNTPQADLNFDGIVDVSDLLIVVGNWGPCE